MKFPRNVFQTISFLKEVSKVATFLRKIDVTLRFSTEHVLFYLMRKYLAK